MTKASARISSLGRRRAAVAPAALLLLSLGAFAPAASAATPQTFKAPPGNNGHIQIHDEGTGVNVDSNDPDVGCFYIDAFGFDPGQALHWEVWTGTPGNPGTQQAAGNANFNPTGTNTGQDISGPIALPQGMYVAFEDDSAGRKTKEFRVTSNCTQGIPIANPKVVGTAGALAAPAAIGFFLWRRRKNQTA